MGIVIVPHHRTYTTYCTQQSIRALFYLSSVCNLSSSSWILLSSWDTPVEERDCPSIPAIRDLYSFIWKKNKKPCETFDALCSFKAKNVQDLSISHDISHGVYLSLQGVFVQFQVLFGGPLLHELSTQLFNLHRAQFSPPLH